MAVREDFKVGDRIELDMSFEAKTIADAPEGFISGIASAPSTDLYGHRVLAKAFDESIKMKGLSGPRGIKLLAYHDWQKVAGVIGRLQTVGDKLEIDAQLNLNVSYVKDLHEVTKQNGGMNFSVGFRLQEYKFVDEDEEKNDDAWLVVEKGDLMEVSVVPFPAQLEAELTFVKQFDNPATLSEFEKALVAKGLCRSRSEAKKLTLAVKASSHLFHDKVTPEAVAAVIVPTHPLLDVALLAPVAELIAKAKATLSGSR